MVGDLLLRKRKEPRDFDNGIDKRLDPYMRLAAAVLRLAVADYIAALRTKDEKNIREFERFFRSPYGEALSLGHGAALIYYARKEAQESDSMTQKEKKKLHPSTE